MEALVRVDVFQHHVHEQGLDDKTEDGEQTRRHAEGKAGGKGDDAVRNEQGTSDIEGRVLAHDHGDDIRAAAGCADMEENGGSDGRQGHGEDQLQERLVRHGRGHGEHAFKHPDESGLEQGHIGRIDPEALPQNDVAAQQENDVDHQAEGTGGGGEVVAENNGNTAHAAGGEIVGVLEKVNADDHDERADGHEDKIRDMLLNGGSFGIGHAKPPERCLFSDTEG